MAIELIAKIAPKNDGFTGMVDADQVIGGGAAGTLLDACVAASNVLQHVKVCDIAFIIDGGGAAIIAGEKGHIEVPFACTITRATSLADQSGSIVVDIWKDSYANFPPTNADTITSATPPTITTATKAQDSTLTSWTTAITAGDVLAYNVDSCTDIERVTISLTMERT